MQVVKRVGVAALILGLTTASALADCREDLAEIDKKIQNAESERPQLMQALKAMRDRGAAACEVGDEQGARTSFMSITMMLGLPDPSRDGEPDVAREAGSPLTARSMPLRSGLSGDEGHGGLGMWGRARDCVSPSDVIQDAPDAGPLRRRAG